MEYTNATKELESRNVEFEAIIQDPSSVYAIGVSERGDIHVSNEDGFVHNVTCSQDAREEVVSAIEKTKRDD